MSKGFASYRIVLLAVAIVGCFCGLGVRLVFLHVIDRDELVRVVEKARRQIIPEPARRGDILDRKDAILATSRSVIVLGVDPQSLRPEDEPKWPELAAMIGMPLRELDRVFRTRTRPLALASTARPPAAQESARVQFAHFKPAAARAEDPPPDVAEITEEDETQLDETPDFNGERPIRWAKLSESVSEATYTRIRALNIRGVYGNRVYRRAYPHRSLAAHIVGFVNKAGESAAGVERYADFYLRGRDGWREGERDGRGREIAQFRTREVPASDGYSVKLSIDTTVQHVVEEELDYIARKFRPEKATIIVSEPLTGFILALANYPNFDLNEYYKVARDDLGVLRNVAVADMYEPGSTFKIVASSAALNEGLVTPATRFDCSIDSIEYKGRVRGLPREDHRFHDPLSVAEIISRSSNRGAAQLAMRLGDQKFHDYIRAFGFGEHSGFPVGGEIRGSLSSPADWQRDALAITRIPMGHGVAATPLQMHMAMGVIASGGELLRPQVISEIRDASGEVVYRYGPVVRQRVIAESTARTMAQLLAGATGPEGTGTAAAIPHYEVAGKTGTTQKIVNGRYSDQQHVASFVGFFPASRPQVAISVIVDNADADTPSGVAYGSAVAAPSFKRIAEQLIQYLGIKPVYAASPANALVMGSVRP